MSTREPINEDELHGYVKRTLQTGWWDLKAKE